MSGENDVELEAKFLVRDLPSLEKRLADLSAKVIQPRIYELNLRFDRADGSMNRSRQVLRLRKDSTAHLTFKGAGAIQDGIQKRTEIEILVSDFEATRRMLQALGYEVCFIYEKYRAMYLLSGTTVCLDEMPFGNFVEVEGNQVAEIQEISRLLKLDWEAHIPVSYTALFDASRAKRRFAFRDLTFENFRDVSCPRLDFPYPFAD